MNLVRITRVPVYYPSITSFRKSCGATTPPIQYQSQGGNSPNFETPAGCE